MAEEAYRTQICEQVESSHAEHGDAFGIGEDTVESMEVYCLFIQYL